MGRRKANIERDLSRITDFERRQSDLEATLELIGEADDPDLQTELAQGLQELESLQI